MRRVAVIGYIAGGKSSLARVPAAKRGLPYHELDRLQITSDWRAVPRPEFLARHAAVIAEPAWVIDGIGLWRSLSDRLLAADAIVHIDHPLWLHFLWTTKRGDGRRERSDDPPPLPELERIFPFIWDYHRRIRPRVLRLLQQLAETKTVHTLRRPEELAAFAAAWGGG